VASRPQEAATPRVGSRCSRASSGGRFWSFQEGIVLPKQLSPRLDHRHPGHGQENPATGSYRRVGGHRSRGTSAAAVPGPFHRPAVPPGLLLRAGNSSSVIGTDPAPPRPAGRCGGSGPSIAGGDVPATGQRSSLRTPVEGPMGPATPGHRQGRRRSVGPLTAGPGVRRSPRHSQPGRRVQPGSHSCPTAVASSRGRTDGSRASDDWRPLATAVNRVRM
jgi:hypothetical protein